MRPSRRLVALVLALAAATVLIGVYRLDGGVMAGALWAVLVVLAICDLALSHGAKNLQVEADLPDTGFVGHDVMLGLRIASRRRSLPRRIELRLTHDQRLAPRSATWVEIPGHGKADLACELPVTLQERGVGHLSRLSMRYASALGLFEVLPAWPLDLSIEIVPDVAPVLNGEIQSQMLPLLDGLKDMKLRGEGSEFHQLRDFQAGMDPRSIDWKRSARMRDLVARETWAERNHQIILCVDSGQLMAERIGKLRKLDHAINASLALTWAGALGGDNVGFYNFASRPQQFIPPRPGRRAFGHVQKRSVELEAETAETNHTLGLTHLNGVLTRRSLVVVFSDFVDSVTVELLVENLAVISRQHLVLYVVLRDPELEALIHPEDISMGRIAEAVSARQMLQERQAVLDRLRRLGILCLDTTPDRLTAGLISRYIDIKSQELI
ncbi:DUF58 domain-containing protein [Salibaculum griseiflavum]|uniref:DUF58 domain-containing protein n=1 Tax=Salibaculum griseiflavum TaxID=1914409 RepID=A0A2V1P843_9RHOB|nr:DUF58 domain-containing protein [Salibaculum griseiflavum]PWG18679.1 DUF58 domain-containing protein [Salibaculum griseiflavum]